MSTIDQLLRLIKRAGKITKPVLLTEYRMTVAKLGDGEFSDAMERLEEAAMIKSTTDKLTGDDSVACTATGIKRVNSF